MQKKTASRAARFTAFAGATALAGLTSLAVTAGDTSRYHQETRPYDKGVHGWNRWKDPAFERIATVPNYLNNGSLEAETVSEIVAATKDGKTLVYTDGAGEAIGFVDINNPYHPAPDGIVGVSGEPTSAAVLDNSLALVAVNTSESFVDPSGALLVIDIQTRAVVRQIDLGGQPDSVAISPDGHYAAVAIENERDEDIVVDGVEGGLPQLPAGFLVIVDIQGQHPKDWSTRTVYLGGLSDYAPEDPEPEFVDINDDNEAVITLQENNHVVIVDLAQGAVTGDFPMGEVTLNGVDTKDDGIIALTDTLKDVPREPDAVAWIPMGKYGHGYGPRYGHGYGYDYQYGIATANEGDLFGGSRGFSIFNRDGEVRFDTGTAFEELAVQHGHYPEGRSDNKGSEPEAIEYGRFGKKDYLFVGSERGSFVAVYELVRGKPRFVQLLPAPLGPEGLLAIPKRDLLIVSGEEDDPSFGVRSTIMIYKRKHGAPSYPQILSAKKKGSPIPWSALSGMTSLPGWRNRGKLLAVWDSFYSESKIFTIDVSDKPALITDALTIQGDSGDYDPEGIAVAPDGTYWIASEGNASDSRPNRLLQVDKKGHVLNEIRLPAEIEACRAASQNRDTLGSGFEGVAVLPKHKGGYKLLVAQQRGWDYTTPECEALDDDGGGLNANDQPNWTRIWIYDPSAGSWDHVAYELAALPEDASWVGLSEITAIGNDAYMLIERDNRTGDFAELKTLVKIRLKDAADGFISQNEKAVYDLIPDLAATNGWISDKPEGTAVTKDGRVFLVTDNDGVDDWSGETSFLELGRVWKLFR